MLQLEFLHRKKPDPVVDVYQLATQVAEKLAPHAEKISAAITRWDLFATLQVVLEISSDDSISTPAIGFDPSVANFLAQVGAGIDIDSYVV